LGFSSISDSFFIFFVRKINKTEDNFEKPLTSGAKKKRERMPLRQGKPWGGSRSAVLQLLASAVVLCAIFVVTSTRLPQRNVLFSYPETTYDGAQLVPRNTYSAERERELEDMPKQDNGELDVDISSAPLQEQVSNMDFSVSVLRPHSKKSHAAPKQGGLTGHHAVVGGVSASWARNARTSALAEIPEASNMQKLSSAYLEDQGINTGEEFNRLLSNRVPMGQENPSVFFSAGRQVADLQPNPPATAYPKPPLNKLTHMVCLCVFVCVVRASAQAGS